MTFRVFLIIGMCAMFLCMCYTGRFYKIPIWKIAIIAVCLTLAGTLGVHLMSLLESGRWSGRSFFGAVFLVPVLMWPVAKLLKIPYGDLMDTCAPAGCIILALMKVKCNIDGCCSGRILDFRGSTFQFPSQKVECAAAVLILLTLLIIIRRKKQLGLVYPWFLLIYGAVRSVLNLFRETVPWIGPLPAGNFWALIAITIGLGIIISKKHPNTKRV